MRKNEPFTLAAKMGFGDHQLTTPKHDEIMIWLDANFENWLKECRYFDEEFAITEKTWEKPIVTGKGNTFTVAFVDLWVKVQIPRGDTHGFAIEVKPEIPSLGELVRQMRHQETYIPNTNFFNQNYGAKLHMMVCSPDMRFEDQLKKQNIEFIVGPGWQKFVTPEEEQEIYKMIDEETRDRGVEFEDSKGDKTEDEQVLTGDKLWWDQVTGHIKDPKK